MEPVPLAESGPSPGAATPEPAVLLATKLTAPTLRPRLITRVALVQALCAGDGRKLSLLDAPAGWGKTTLLAQWIAQERERNEVAWLSLDPADNDPARFWTYVVAAMQKACPGLDARTVELIKAHADLQQIVLPTLLNELASLDEEIVLILDDYDVVTTRAIHEEMAFFIERMPPNLRLVIATRSDPPLPLARLRAEGHLLEIRADDLRFAEGEASRMLNEALGLSLAAADIELLWQRTEGWAAGLYLAALSLEGRSDTDSFIRAFAGDNRHIVDYLSAEVLDGQPPAIRHFLLRTAVLERLSGPLCDAVVDTSGSVATLEQIERDNLFLIALDSSRHWYRYHHLFGDLLRNEMRRTEPALIPRLHERAAAWFRAEDLNDEAVRHLSAAGDMAGAAELITERWGAEFNRGWLSTVSAWLDLLPEQTVTRNPRLCLARAWIALDMRRLSDAARWIDAAQAGVSDYLTRQGRRASAGPHLADPCGIFPADTMEAEIAVLRAVQVFKAGDVARAVDVAGQAAHSDLGDVPLGRSAAYCVYGAALYWSGRTRKARAVFSRAVQLSDSAANLLGRTYSLGYLALIAAERGQLAEADRLIHQTAEDNRHSTVGEHFVDMMPALAIAKVLDRRGATVQAADAADRAVVLSLRGGGNLEVANALLVRSEILRHLGESEAARSSVAEARALLRDCPDPGLASELLAAGAGKFSGSGSRPAGPDVPAPALPEQLTSKELQLLRLLPTSLSRREIGARLFVSLNTVKTHQRGLYRKLGVTERAAAVKRGRALGLLPPGQGSQTR
ncbi:MAG TPA: LuxR C-terminal-related transcriptional regulator [Streptosporangiaceae bacterium]|nr:LuxR C-terminal-related transcriptional regulator [Streptosporangiaceae bacterium]